MRSLRLTVRSTDVDLVSDRLWSAGVRGIEELPGGGNAVVLVASFPDALERAVLRSVESFESPGLDEMSVADADGDRWRDAWRPWASAAQLSDSLWVTPCWVTPDAEPNSVVLSIEPGQAWGHGAHPTTVLCARWIMEEAGPGSSLLDVGCGSGVLSLVAAHAGSAVTACDIDPEARQVTAANARANGLAQNIDVRDQAIASIASDVEQGAQRPWDVVVANLGLAEFRTCAGQLIACCAPGATIVLSGILESQLAETAALFEPCVLDTCSQDDGWVAAVFSTR